MSEKKPFNEEETAILLDLCQWISKNEYPRSSMLVILSTVLRNLAINNGEKIDKSFRSTSGLNYQLSVMMQFISSKARNSNAPKIFVSVYGERQKHFGNFQNKLWEALYMANNDNFKQGFLKYLTSKKPAIASDIYWAMEKAEEYAYSHKMTDKSLYMDLNVNHINSVESKLLADKTFTSKNIKILFHVKQGFALLKEYAAENSKKSSITTNTVSSFGAKDTAADSVHIKHIPIEAIKATEEPAQDADILTITFSNDIITDDSVPVSFTYYNQKIDNLVSWADLYVRFMKIFWMEQNRHLKEYMEKSFVDQKTIDLGSLDSSKSMAAPKRIANNVFLETKLNSRSIVKRIKAVLDISKVPPKRLTITYSQPKTVFDSKSSFTSTEVSETNRADRQVNFEVIQDLSYTKPVSCNLDGVLLDGISSWTNLYVKIVSLLWEKYPAMLKSYAGKNFNGGTRIDLSYKCQISNMKEPKMICNDSYDNEVYLETNLNAKDIVSKIKALVKLCGLSYDAVIIQYEKKTVAERRKSSNSLSEFSANVNSQTENHTEKSEFAQNLIQKCNDILREYFQNGFKKGAAIASKKFKKRYLDVYGEEFPENMEPEEIIRTITIEYAEKYYLISDEALKYIETTIKKHIERGQQIFFYSMLYAKYSTKLTEFSIYSDTMLKTVLESIFSKYSCKKNYFSPNGDMNIEKAMALAYGEEVSLSFDELENRLPFVEKEQFNIICSRDSQFVKVSDKRYALANRIHISDTDVKLSLETLREDMANQGYSFLTRIIVKESEEYNPEISESAMQTVLFDNYLSKEYSRNRYLIAPYGEAVSIMTVLKNYCKDCTRITLNEIEQYEYELTGDENSRRSLKAAVSSMVRIDENTFVNSVSFDVKAADEAIALFMNSRVISLNSITSFNSFPNVDGYVWNSFLLESYLMHYSVKWSFIGEDYKKKSIGAIFGKNISFDSYDNAIARAVADSGIDLSQNEVCAYLMKEEFRLRKGDFNDIITKAHKIRLQEE